MRGMCRLLVIMAFIAVAAPRAFAQRVMFYPRPVTYGGPLLFPNSGWYGGIGLSVTRIVDQRGGPERLHEGAGLRLYAGLRANEQLSLEFSWLSSHHNPAKVKTLYGAEIDYLVLNGVTADARFHLSQEQVFAPYLQGGVGLYSLGSQIFGTDSVGTGFQLGGGFDYALNSLVNLNVRVLYLGIGMGQSDNAENDTYISAANAEASLALKF